MVTYGHAGDDRATAGEFATARRTRLKLIVSRNPIPKPVFSTEGRAYVTKQLIVSYTLLDEQCLPPGDTLAPCLPGANMGVTPPLVSTTHHRASHGQNYVPVLLVTYIISHLHNDIWGFAMDPLRDFDQRLAAIHSLNSHDTVDPNSGVQRMDIRHSEFQAMADAFLGDNFDKVKLRDVENLQVALHEQQALLYERYEEGHIGPEEYVNSFNALLDNTFTECEKILGPTDFEKLFRAPRAELGGFIDREAFLHAYQSRPQADKPPMGYESQDSPSRMAAEASWLLMVCQDQESFAKASVFSLNVCNELTTLSELLSDSLKQQDIPAMITIQSKRMLLPQPIKAAENLKGVVTSAQFQHIRKNLSEWAASPKLPSEEDLRKASETFARIAPLLAESAI